ncbi:hypothetical protein [Nocardia sp. NPDC051463]|uniref:hypothetical protein n=1 Tax=Nocardia sp. NPDC051463 TaxID=3154845 RepID=UPI00343D47B3
MWSWWRTSGRWSVALLGASLIGVVVVVVDVVEGTTRVRLRVAVLFAAARVVAPWRWRKASSEYGFRP